MNHITHTPVMLHKAIDELRLLPGKTYIDATFGGGGHTAEMLKKGAKVIAFETDEYAIDHAPASLTKDVNLTLIHDNFENMDSNLAELHIKKVAGVLFDLGTSAFQLEGENRGFSFQKDELLDMRMNKNLTVTAKDLVNALSVKELTQLIRRFSQEPKAKSIAQHIVDYRKEHSLETTKQLADLIMNQAYKGNRGKLHPATKTFQALRIAVNDELNAFESALNQAIKHIEVDGRVVVISFHEGEDRIAKNILNQKEDVDILIHHTKNGPLTPTEEEISKNRRSRSAKMRIGEITQ